MSASPIVLAQALSAASTTLSYYSYPDLLFDRLANKDATVMRDISAGLDRRLAVMRLVAVPLYGYLLDDYGPWMTFILANTSAATTRLLSSFFPGNKFVYSLYRITDAVTFLPAITSSTMMLADVYGGKNSEAFLTNAKRLVVLLAFVRAAAAKMAGSTQSNSLEVEKFMRVSSILALVSALMVGLFVKESDVYRKRREEERMEIERERKKLREKQAAAAASASASNTPVKPPSALAQFFAADPKTSLDHAKLKIARVAVRFFLMWKSSLAFFFKDEKRKALALLLIVKALPLQISSQLQEHYRFKFHWEGIHRADIIATTEIIASLAPLAAIELFKKSSYLDSLKAEEKAKLALRLNALAVINTALTPTPATVLINPLLENIIPSSNELYDRCLSQIVQASAKKGLATSSSSSSLPSPTPSPSTSVESQTKTLSPLITNPTISLATSVKDLAPTTKTPGGSTIISEAQLEAAIELLQFPLAFSLPTLFNTLSPGNTTLQLLVVAGCCAFGSEYAIEDVVKHFKI